MQRLNLVSEYNKMLSFYTFNLHITPVICIIWYVLLFTQLLWIVGDFLLNFASTCMAQWLERSTWKLEVVGSIPRLIKLTIINCLSDETLNWGPMWQCYTPSTLKNQTELWLVLSCILALSPVTTNCLLGVLLRWANEQSGVSILGLRKW